MHEFLQVLGGVIPLYLIIGVGGAIRRFGILNEEADRTLTGLCVHLLVPCMILDHIIPSETLRHTGNLLWSPLVGFAATAGCIGIAWIAAKLYRLEPMQVRTFGFLAGVYNYGYIPVPIMAALYSADTLGVLFLYNLGVEIAFWIVGFALLTGHSVLSDWRRAFTTPVRAIILGVAINLLTAHFGVLLDAKTLDAASWGWSVKWILDTVHYIGQCAIPLALMLTGATIADFWNKFHGGSGVGVMSLAVLVRNGIGPLAMVAMAWLLPVSNELKETLVVQAAMPAGVFPLVLARHYGGSVPVAVQVIVSTSVVAIITLPLWIHFGMQWVGLK